MPTWRNKPNAKAAVLKTASNRVKAVCGLESHFFLNWRVNLLGNRDYLLNRLYCKKYVFRVHCSAPSTSFMEEKTMYFIVRYNWQDKLTNKCSVGFFKSLKNAIKFVTFYIDDGLSSYLISKSLKDVKVLFSRQFK